MRSPAVVRRERGWCLMFPAIAKSRLRFLCLLLPLFCVTNNSPANSQIQSAKFDWNKQVTLTAEKADIRLSLKQLFTSAGVSYTIDQGVQGSVTASLNNMPFRD